MAEPFRNLLNPALVGAAAHHLKRIHRSFDAAGFERAATRGLDDIPMKARALQIADALQAHLPDDFDAACGVIEQALAPAPAPEDERLDTLSTGEKGLAGWIVWPLGEVVARGGAAAPERALQALHALTQRHTAEWALRPVLQAHTDLTLATLQRWTTDPSVHVRRLVSEGSRPRLPWGEVLRFLIEDPSPTAPLLEALQDDRSAYVRRSVANHLNDVARDHPGRLVGWLQRHLPGASDDRRALLRHASRGRIKAGDAAVLAAWGTHQPFEGEVAWSVSPSHVVLGGTLTWSAVLRSRAAAPQKLEVDVVMHHVKASGATSPKVFKGWRLTLDPGQRVELSRAHPLREITTRRYHPGRHAVTLQVNGHAVAEAAFDLSLPPASPGPANADR